MKRLFIIILIFFSCKEYVFDYEPEINVHCILRNDKNIQKIRVGRTYRIDEISKYDLKDVNIILYSIINDSIITDTLVVQDSTIDTLGIYVTKGNFDILPGSLCSLVVTARYKDTLYLDTLFGKTIIPSSFSILYPLNDDTIGINDTLIINDLTSDEQLYYIETHFEDGRFTEQWTFDKKLSIKDFIFEESGRYKIKVFKVDRNFYEYYYSNTFEDKVLRCGVTGGVGLFGSMLAESLYFYLNFK